MLDVQTAPFVKEAILHAQKTTSFSKAGILLDVQTAPFYKLGILLAQKTAPVFLRRMLPS